MHKHPPKAPLAFRVGIVGHRPNRLQKADLQKLSEVVGQILGVVRDRVTQVGQANASIYEQADPEMRAISPLAEGSDRLFAREALTLGYKLTAVLPFAKSEFEQDFQPEKALEEDSLQAFRSLLEKADPVFQLDGSRTNEGRAYGVAGRTVLFNSDLLIVIWDGERQNKPGGTEETLADAQQAGIPVIWIHAEAGHAWRLLDPSVAWGELKKEDEPQEGQGDFDELGTRIETVLGLPQIASGKHEAKVDSSHKHLANFYREKNPGWKLSVGWKAFRDILGDFKFPRVTFAVKP